jgi:hypothetical protein
MDVLELDFLKVELKKLPFSSFQFENRVKTKDIFLSTLDFILFG